MKIATLGLDLSIASTGIAHIASDGAVRAGKVTTKPSTKGKQPQSVLFSDADRRIAVIRDSIVQHLVLGGLEPPAFVYIESPLVGVSGHTAIVLAMLHGVVRADFHRDGTPVNVISPTTVAKHSGITTTMVREAKKAAMIASANERWGMTLGPKDDDIADAIWLADLAQVEWRDGAVS